MAIGMGKMVGLNYLENFNYPYISRSITEFWRRWHMSLGTFFRDYVYIPLGGNRVSVPRAIFNTFVVWALTGLWHGASWNFVLWGLWFFVFLMLERFALKKFLAKVPVVSNFYAVFVVVLGWVIFRFTNTELMVAAFKSLFGMNGNALSSFAAETLLKNNLFLLLASIFISLPVMKWLRNKLEVHALHNPDFGKVWNVVIYSVIPVVLLLLSTAALVGDSYNPFIYFQF
jgi:alginate O-acetyltransferase complex protein AlgI